MLELNRNQLAVARAKCDKSLLFFTRFWYKVLRNQKFITNWHHEVICKDIEDVETYNLELLNINIPPRHSKTELAAVNFIARGIGMNPSANYLYIAASDELRSETSTRIRDIVQHPYFKIMYGVELKKDQNAKNLWRTTQGGGLKTATIFGQITGFGAGQMVEHDESIEDIIRDFEGAIVLDDLNKTDDAAQQNANNDKVSRVISNTILSRKNSKDTPIINIQQRAGITDATEQFKRIFGEDNPKVRFRVMPVISEGTALWPFIMDVEQINRLRTGHETAHMFDGQYMQDPQPLEGLLFPSTKLQRFSMANVEMDYTKPKLAFIDTADEGDDNHSVPLGILNEGKIFITDVLFTKKGTDVNVAMTADLIDRNNPEYCRVESNFGGTMYVNLLQMKLKGPTVLLPIRAQGNKHSRIYQMAGFVIQFFVFRDDYEPGSDYDLFMKNLTTYLVTGDVKHDDAPDSVAGLATMFREFYYDEFSSNHYVEEDGSA